MTSVSRVCSIAECDNPVAARGLCNMHYSRAKSAGNLPDHRYQTPEERKARAAARDAKYYQANKNKLKKYRSDHYFKNREKRLEQVRAWTENNRELVTEYGHRRRVRIRGGLNDKHTLADVIAKYGTDCHLCGEPIDMDAPRKCGTPGWELSFHKDHVIPISRGGDNTIDNVRPSHGICNLKKWANLL